jgi:hypothetical protein
MRGWFWELNGYYRAARGYGGQGRLRALANTMIRGWRG